MQTRVSPTERIRAESDDLFAKKGDLRFVPEGVARRSHSCCCCTNHSAKPTEDCSRPHRGTNPHLSLRCQGGECSFVAKHSLS